MGYIQDRKGHNKIHTIGLLQPVSYIIKLLTTEYVVMSRRQECRKPKQIQIDSLISFKHLISYFQRYQEKVKLFKRHCILLQVDSRSLDH